MSTFNDWLLQPAKYGGNELYLPSRFLPCWSNFYGNQTEYNYGNPYCCYIPDELKCKTFDINNHGLNGADLDDYADYIAGSRPYIQVSNLTHFTNVYGFNSINNQGVIKAFPKYLHEDLTGPGNHLKYRFVWFTATVGDQGAEIIRDSIWHRRREIYGELHYDKSKSSQYNFMANQYNYATSSPFTKQGHPCGSNYFGYHIDSLLQSYCHSVSGGDFVSRQLGTFVYKKEVMFAVVIHPPEAYLSPGKRSFFRKFPRLDGNDDYRGTVVFKKNGRFYWKPFSTSSKFAGSQSSVYCRWDQLAFAFYFPQNHIGFYINDLE